MMEVSHTNQKPKYCVSPNPVRTPWHDKNFTDARRTFDTQCRYITGLLDTLFSQKIITSETALTLEAAINDLKISMNEVEIAIRRDYQEKKNEDN